MLNAPTSRSWRSTARASRTAGQATRAEPHRPGVRLLHHRRRGRRGRGRPRHRPVALPPASHRPVRRGGPPEELRKALADDLCSVFPPNDYALIAVILGMPLLGAFVNGVWGKRLGKPAVRLMALGAVGVSFLAAARRVRRRCAQLVEARRTDEHVKLVWTAWEWMHTTGGPASATCPSTSRFSIDALSGVMMLVVTGRRLPHPPLRDVVHGEGQGYARFFAYLNLFIFSMLVLILGDNLPDPLRRLGGRRALLLPAHRLLVRRSAERRGGQEGLHREPHRRLRPHLRDVPPRLLHGRARLERDRQRRDEPRSSRARRTACTSGRSGAGSTPASCASSSRRSR